MGIPTSFSYIFSTCCFIWVWKFFTATLENKYIFLTKRKFIRIRKYRINDTTFGIFSTRYNTFSLRLFGTESFRPRYSLVRIFHPSLSNKWRVIFEMEVVVPSWNYYWKSNAYETLCTLDPKVYIFQWRVVSTNPFRREKVVIYNLLLLTEDAFSAVGQIFLQGLLFSRNVEIMTA